jgi:hypothetical protein
LRKETLTRYNPSTGNYDVTTISSYRMGIRYQYIRNLIKKPQTNLQPQLALGVFGIYRKQEPISINQFKGTHIDFINYLQLSPQMTYRLKDVVQISLALPISLTLFTGSYTCNLDPLIAKDDQVISYTDDYFEWHDYFQIRLGVGARV